jgi:hypothetical protein
LANIEDLLGKSYAELSRVPVLRGASILPTEQIDDRSYVSLRPMGISLVLDNRTVSAVHLYSDGHEGFSQYAGPLPGGISFSTDRAEVRRRLGVPDRSGEETVMPILGKMPPWDTFHVDNLRVHVEYTPGVKSIRLVTVNRK